MTIPNRAPSTVWGMRRGWNDGYVTTDVDETILMVGPWQHVYVDDSASDSVGLRMSRTDAALLAKRIRQCLDGTAKGGR